MRWTEDEVIEAFDTTNITLAELATRSGWSVKELKRLLMGG